MHTLARSSACLVATTIAITLLMQVGSVAAIAPTPLASPVADQRTSIDQLLAGEPGVYGVVLIDQTGTLRYSRNADTPFVAASLYKLVLIADIFRRVEEGQFALTQELPLLPEYFAAEGTFYDGYFDEAAVWGTTSIEEALFAAGAYSSNVAALALLALTDSTTLDALATQFGMPNTRFFANPLALGEWPPTTGDDTTDEDVATAAAFVEANAWDGWVMLTTPRDTATFFAALLDGKIVSPETSAAILGILLRQTIADRFPVLLPPGTSLAHKTGDLDHVVHDAGIIFTPTGPVILVAMVEACPDDDRAIKLIQTLAKIAYEGGK